MKKILPLLLTLGTILSCGPAFDPEEVHDEILGITGTLHTSVTHEDYDRLCGLIRDHEEEFDRYLEQQGDALEFKNGPLDALHEEAFDNYRDTLSLVCREEICHWTMERYPSDSEAYTSAEQRLIEIYVSWKKYGRAAEILEDAFGKCPRPSLEYATLLYTKAWLESEMDDWMTSMETITQAQDNYNEIIRRAKEALQQDGLTEEERAGYEKMIIDGKAGLRDAEEFLGEF